jgi:hypothetical protein
VEPNDAIAALYQQAAHIVGTAGGSTSADHVQSAYRTLTTFSQVGDHVSLGLYPLALAILIFHENFQAATGDGRFRVAYVLGRAAAIAALIHPWGYGRLCGLITYAAGGHGGWLSGDALLDQVSKTVDGLKGAWTDYAGDDPGIGDSISALINILPLVGIWLVLVCCLLLAYIAGVLLGLSQAVLLSILLAVGKTCITVSLVPGVGLGGSWARSLAKVAAWSTVAAIVTALMTHTMPDLRGMVRNLGYTRMLRTSGQFVVLAICTFAVPVITERIFSGAAPAGNAALDAVRKGWYGMRSMGRLVSSSQGPGDRATGRGDSTDNSGSGGRSYRPHKVSPSRLRQGLAAAGALAVAPIAAFDAMRRRVGSSTPPPAPPRAPSNRVGELSAPAEDAGTRAFAEGVLRRSRPAYACETGEGLRDAPRLVRGSERQGPDDQRGLSSTSARPLPASVEAIVAGQKEVG